MLEYKYDTQMLIEGENLSEDEINRYIKEISGATACWLWATNA